MKKSDALREVEEAFERVEIAQREARRVLGVLGALEREASAPAPMDDFSWMMYRPRRVELERPEHELVREFDREDEPTKHDREPSNEVAKAEALPRRRVVDREQVTRVRGYSGATSSPREIEPPIEVPEEEPLPLVQLVAPVNPVRPKRVELERPEHEIGRVFRDAIASRLDECGLALTSATFVRIPGPVWTVSARRGNVVFERSCALAMGADPHDEHAFLSIVEAFGDIDVLAIPLDVRSRARRPPRVELERAEHELVRAFDREDEPTESERELPEEEP